MQVQPYLFFNGRCDEALAFYRSALGAEVPMLVRYKSNPQPGTTPPGWDEKVMHARVCVGNSVLLVSDGSGAETSGFQGFSLSLTVADEAAAERAFSALCEGGEVRMPLEKTFFSPLFGMVKDRFGVGWMVYVEQ